MYLKGIKELFKDDSMHIEKAEGTCEQNFAYCSKDKDFFEFGKKKSGGKNIQDNIKELTEKFMVSDRIEFIEDNMAFYNRY